MSHQKLKTILAGHFPEKIVQVVIPVASVKNKELSDRLGIELITSQTDLRAFLAKNEVNAVLLSEKEMDDLSDLQASVALTGLPIYSINQNGELVHLSGDARVSNIELVLKRLVDILAASGGLLLTGLVAILISPIVKKQSPGPLLFKQERVGKQGKKFHMYKFRSMYLDAEERKKELLDQNEVSSDLMFKLENDPRIFPFGQKLRNWSIDELPQFINVLKGDMSLIGTRPPTVDEVDKYELHHFKRLAMKPGITGMWQVSGRSNIQDFEEVVKLDVSYIDNWSIWLDLKIILKTIKVVLKREGSK